MPGRWGRSPMAILVRTAEASTRTPPASRRRRGRAVPSAAGASSCAGAGAPGEEEDAGEDRRGEEVDQRHIDAGVEDAPAEQWQDDEADDQPDGAGSEDGHAPAQSGDADGGQDDDLEDEQRDEEHRLAEVEEVSQHEGEDGAGQRLHELVLRQLRQRRHAEDDFREQGQGYGGARGDGGGDEAAKGSGAHVFSTPRRGYGMQNLGDEFFAYRGLRRFTEDRPHPPPRALSRLAGEGCGRRDAGGIIRGVFFQERLHAGRCLDQVVAGLPFGDELGVGQQGGDLLGDGEGVGCVVAGEDEAGSWQELTKARSTL